MPPKLLVIYSIRSSRKNAAKYCLQAVSIFVQCSDVARGSTNCQTLPTLVRHAKRHTALHSHSQGYLFDDYSNAKMSKTNHAIIISMPSSGHSSMLSNFSAPLPNWLAMLSSAFTSSWPIVLPKPSAPALAFAVGSMPFLAIALLL